jgi:hypothetical protein
MKKASRIDRIGHDDIHKDTIQAIAHARRRLAG